MANKQTLKPLGTGSLTEAEEREIRSKGGKACAKKRREAKALGECYAVLLGARLTDRDAKAAFKRFGIDEDDDKTAAMRLAIGAYDNAVRKGDDEEAERIFNRAGLGQSDTEKAAHAAFLKALTASEDQEEEE